MAETIIASSVGTFTTGAQARTMGHIPYGAEVIPIGALEAAFRAARAAAASAVVGVFVAGEASMVEAEVAVVVEVEDVAANRISHGKCTRYLSLLSGWAAGQSLELFPPKTKGLVRIGSVR